MISEHGDALEADLQQHYGVALGDLYTGRLTLRRLRVLIDQMPAYSRIGRELGDVPPDLVHWTLDSALLGRLVDEVSALRWEYEAVHADRRHLRPEPKSVLPHVDAEPTTATVIPLVSPHRLGAFINDTTGESSGD